MNRNKFVTYSIIGLIFFLLPLNAGNRVDRAELRKFIELHQRAIAEYVSKISCDIWKASWTKSISRRMAQSVYGVSGDAFDRIPWKFCLQKLDKIKKCIHNVVSDDDIEYVARGIDGFISLNTKDKNRLALFLYNSLTNKITLSGSITRERLQHYPNDLEAQVGYGVSEQEYNHLNAANFIIKYYLEEKGFVNK